MSLIMPQSLARLLLLCALALTPVSLAHARSAAAPKPKQKAPVAAPKPPPVAEPKKGYAGVPWGATSSDTRARMGPKRLKPRRDTAFVVLESEVQALERDEALRLARRDKKPAKAIKALKAKRPEPVRFSAQHTWVKLGRLDAQVMLHFLDDRLWGVDLSVPFGDATREDAAEVLDLLSRRYGDPVARRGEDKPGAPVVDTFDAGAAVLEAFQQPAREGRAGFLRLEYRARDLSGAAAAYVDELRKVRRDIELARNPPPPTPEALDEKRRNAILEHL